MVESVGYMYWNHPEWLTAPVRGYTQNPDWMEEGTEIIPLVRKSDYDALARKCEGLARDAARYRWLRISASIFWNGWIVYENMMATDAERDEMDRAIDAAIATDHLSQGGVEETK